MKNSDAASEFTFSGRAQYVSTLGGSPYADIVASGLAFVDEFRSFAYSVTPLNLLVIELGKDMRLVREVGDRPFRVTGQTYPAFDPTKKGTIEIFKVIVAIQEAQIAGEVHLNTPLYRILDAEGAERELWLDLVYSVVGGGVLPPTKLQWSCYTQEKSNDGR